MEEDVCFWASPIALVLNHNVALSEILFRKSPATLSPSSGEASVSFFSRRGSQDVCTIGTAASQGAAAAQLLCVAAGRASTHVPIFHSVGHSLQPGLMTMSLLE